jgi:hypothetical protein
LDNDDEITDAVARLRVATDEQVVFVVPAGSRIATGRMNFKILAREADTRALELAVASSDEQVRALANSAGVLALPTADEAVAALERGDEPPKAHASGAKAAFAVGSEVAESPSTAVRTPSTRRRNLGIAVVAVLGLGLLAGYTALQTLPTADVSLTPRIVPLGPIELSIVATTSASEPDVEAAQVPAIELPIPLRIERTFPATGVEAVSEPAVGEVRFTSSDTFQDIATGTRVMTPSGVEFRTTASVTLAPPTSGQLNGSVLAPVEAVAAGPEGNVPPGTITVAPSLEDQGISVSNAQPTSGGRRVESAVVTAEDYDAATADLQNRLAGALAAYLRDPANTPEGLTVYNDSARTGPVSHRPSAEDLVGSRASEFALEGAVEGSVLAVDDTLVSDLAREALATEVPTGMEMLPGSIDVEFSATPTDRSSITYRTTAQGEGYRFIDAPALTEQIAGLPISEARAILDGLGVTTVTVWPEFVGDLPGDPSRITLDVREPSTTE